MYDVHFIQQAIIIAKDRSFIVDGWGLKKAKFDKIILTINEGKKVICVDYFISNVAL